MDEIAIFNNLDFTVIGTEKGSASRHYRWRSTYVLRMNEESASAILRTYARKRRGSDRFTRELIGKMEGNVYQASNLDSLLVAQIVVFLRFCWKRRLLIFTQKRFECQRG